MAGRKRSNAGEELLQRYSSRQSQKDATRQRIAEAALEVFTEQGFQAATIEEIAKRAGIGRTTFYLHFGAKVDLANEIGLSEYPRFEASWLRLSDVAPGDVEGIRHWLARHKRTIASARGVHSIATQANIADPILARDLLDVYERTARALVRLIRGVDEPDQADVETARLLLLAMDRTLYITVIQKVRATHELDEAAVDLVGFTLERLHRP